MKKATPYTLFFLFFYSGITFSIVSYDALPKAVVVVPVADLVRAPLQEEVSVDQLYQAYQELEYQETNEECPHQRACQLLFNEEVGVVACRGDEVLVHIPHVYFQENRGAIPQKYYWMLKDVLLYVDDLRELCTDCTRLPPPIKSSYTNLEACNNNVVTLAMPYKDTKTNTTYSAGTRFVCTGQNDDNVIRAYALNGNTLLFDTLEIPRSIGIFYEKKSKSERIDDYIALIRRWITCQSGVIPYVWGGASFTHHVIENTSWNYYPTRKVHVSPTFEPYPYVGFDCSCLIWRASLATGIPYFFSNSCIMRDTMRARVLGENIQKGDILWFEGHVIIASNIEDNMIIEARGYGAGYGRLHEIPLSEMFAHTSTYADLEQACFNHNKPITLLHRDGSIRLIIDDFMILAFQESW